MTFDRCDATLRCPQPTDLTIVPSFSCLLARRSLLSFRHTDDNRILRAYPLHSKRLLTIYGGIYDESAETRERCLRTNVCTYACTQITKSPGKKTSDGGREAFLSIEYLAEENNRGSIWTAVLDRSANSLPRERNIYLHRRYVDARGD